MIFRAFFACPELLVLIETYWNVNEKNNRNNRVSNCRINRNILECKCYNVFPDTYYLFRINRNILECKLKIGSAVAVTPVSVLIETYWNVNISFLISAIATAVCINRNILECKYYI